MALSLDSRWPFAIGQQQLTGIPAASPLGQTQRVGLANVGLSDILSPNRAGFGPDSIVALSGKSKAADAGQSSQATASTQLEERLNKLKSWRSGLSDIQNRLSDITLSNSAVGYRGSETTSVVTSTVQTGTTVTTSTTLVDKTYDISVTALATGQIATIASASKADDSLESKKSSTGQIRIEMGAYDAATKSFTASGTEATINVGGVGSLNDIRDAINSSGLALTASVVQSGKNYELQVSSSETGKASAFRITVLSDDADSNLANNKGLSQIAFNPASGKSDQNAQDAAYTVDGVAGTSATNTGVAIADGVTVDFNSTGSMSVTRQIEETVTTETPVFETITTVVASTSTDLDSSLAAAAYGLARSLGDFADIKETAAMAGEDLVDLDGGSGLGDIGIRRGYGLVKVEYSTLAQYARTNVHQVNAIFDDALGALSQAVSENADKLDKAIAGLEEELQFARQLEETQAQTRSEFPPDVLRMMQQASEAYAASASIGHALGRQGSGGAEIIRFGRDRDDSLTVGRDDKRPWEKDDRQTSRFGDDRKAAFGLADDRKTPWSADSGDSDRKKWYEADRDDDEDRWTDRQRRKRDRWAVARN